MKQSPLRVTTIENTLQVFMKRCHCIKGDGWFQTEMEEDILNKSEMFLTFQKDLKSDI